ncbi:MAG: hypothetical protein ACT4O0_18390 [Pseudonocardia sp.]
MRPLLLAQEYRPAGGAALGQVAIATGLALVLATILLGLGYGHRTGRFPLLERLGALAERSPLTRGLPIWVALPSALALVSLVTALLGMYWDISLHISRGRDEGPLANIAHYPILFGLFGIFGAGILAIMLPRAGERPGPAAIRISDDWYAPVGGVLLAGSGFYALLGFPLDDVWHRIFGQDVTLWGPTHLMLLGGAGLSLVAMTVLEREGALAVGDARVSPVGRFIRRGMTMGGLLIGLSVFQAEFDFGVPQFRMVHQPLLIAMAAATALVAARWWLGRGGALFAVGFYFAVRGGVSVVVGGVIGELWAAVPLYVAEALLVELVAAYLASDRRTRPLAFGVVSGLAIGTVGFAAEYAWSGLVMPLPWTPDMVVEGVLMACAGGVAGGVAGALLGMGLTGRLHGSAGGPAGGSAGGPAGGSAGGSAGGPAAGGAGSRRAARPGVLFAASVALLAVALANGLATTVPEGVRAELEVTAITPTSADSAQVRVTPESALDDPTWLQLTGWQGGDLHLDRLVPTGDGAWRTTRPLPLGGNWKLLVRLHDGRTMTAVPLYLPADPALNAPELPAEASATRDAVHEQLILQRELNQGVSGWVWTAASLLVLLCTLALLAALAWGVGRVSRSSGHGSEPARESAPTAG